MTEPVLTRFQRVVYPHRDRLSKRPKIRFVLEELLSTEREYVRELDSIIEFYVKPFESAENLNQIEAGLRGQSRVIFGNICELHTFHSFLLFPKLIRVADSPSQVCQIFINYHNCLLEMYRTYCLNKIQSDALFRDYSVDDLRFFTYCQKRAGHKLPLSSYLVKPIQRITKYQLLLKELLRYCNDDPSCESIRSDVQSALTSMLDLLDQLNSNIPIVRRHTI